MKRTRKGKKVGAAPAPGKAVDGHGHRRRTLQLRAVLLNTDPPIWRTFQVSDDMGLDTLHLVLQSVMGWDNYHMHHFIAGSRSIGVPDPEDMMMDRAEDERQVALSDLFPPGQEAKANAKTKGNRILYEYDFGDGWMHSLSVEKVVQTPGSGKGGPARPVCIAGERACPPEDCGGVLEYSRVLKVLKKPKGRLTRDDLDLLDWLGDFSPDNFDPEAANMRLLLVPLLGPVEVDEEVPAKARPRPRPP